MQFPDFRNILGYTLAAYAAGTAYSLTATQAQVAFGTTSPSITLDRAGTWLIFAAAALKANAATFAAVQTATLKLRRTNNTAADLTSATRDATVPIMTTLTDNAGLVQIPAVVYTTQNVTDIIQLFGAVSVIPSAGSLDVISAEIMALRLLGA